jgi:nucleotide-binding universal stress UspA family protein
VYDRILVPTDGSEGAAAAARHAARLGRAFDGEVVVLSVVDERAFSADLADLDPAVGERRESGRRQAREAIDAIETLLAETSVSCRTAIEEGVPHEVIVEYATDHDVDLISMGTHGRTGLDRVLIGSVAERVVRTSDVPVLTSRLAPAADGDYDRILLPTDGSEAATAALEHGLAIAERFDATVHALSVVDLDALAGAAEAGSAIPAVIEGFEEDCERAVEDVADRCAERDLDVVTAVVEGSPSRAIREYVKEEEIDLVAMGTHGRTGLERYLIGSVTERLVRTCDAPVLTVR